MPQQANGIVPPVPAVRNRGEAGSDRGSFVAKRLELYLTNLPLPLHLINDELAVSVDTDMLNRSAIAELLSQEEQSFDERAVLSLVVGHRARGAGVVAPFQYFLSCGTGDVKAPVSLAGIRIRAAIEGDDIGRVGSRKGSWGAAGRPPK